MLIKKGEQQIELTNDEVSTLYDAITRNTNDDDRPGDYEYNGDDIDLTPRCKVGGRVPKEGDKYWVIYEAGVIDDAKWECIFDRYATSVFELGNAFWDKAEVEKELKRRKAEYRLKQVAEEAWEKYGPTGRNDYTSVDYYDKDADEFVSNNPVDSVVTPGAIKFPNCQAIRKSFKTNRQDWLDYLGV